MKLRLFVWEGVLADYTAGIAFALAHNADEAKLLLIADGVPADSWNGILLEGEEPKEYTVPTAKHVYGGG